MKIWVDDVRPAPEGYVWCKSVNETKQAIKTTEKTSVYALMNNKPSIAKTYWITLIDIDHDAGEFVSDGGDYIKLLDWLEETGRNYPIRIHSQNPVGIENMRRIIERNGWEEVK